MRRAAVVNPRALRRFIILLAVFTAVVVLVTDGLDAFLSRAPGDYHTELGTQRLEDERYEEALAHYANALAQAPNHRGALMGRALVFIAREEYPRAIRELDRLIAHLAATLEAEDGTGRGVLAAAHANRGVVLDRTGRYREALESYVRALEVDAEAVSGPGVVHEILHGSAHVSTVRDRARYLHEQLALPEAERLLRVPELDARQRMHQP